VRTLSRGEYSAAAHARHLDHTRNANATAVPADHRD
jgi:hypothetical protein